MKYNTHITLSPEFKQQIIITDNNDIKNMDLVILSIKLLSHLNIQHLKLYIDLRNNTFKQPIFDKESRVVVDYTALWK